MLPYNSCHFYACAVINLMIGAWQKGQITWIAVLWLVVGHAILLIDPVALLIYVTSNLCIVMYIAGNEHITLIGQLQQPSHTHLNWFRSKAAKTWLNCWLHQEGMVALLVNIFTTMGELYEGPLSKTLPQFDIRQSITSTHLIHQCRLLLGVWTWWYHHESDLLMS